MFMMIGALFVIALLVMAVFMICKKFKDKIRTKLVGLKNKMLFNGLIRSILVAYYKTLMSAGLQMRYWLRGDDIDAKSKVIGVGLFTFCCAFPIVFTYLIRSYYKAETIDSVEF